METFYVMGSRPSKFGIWIVSWLIRLFTWSRISHVYFLFSDKNIFHAYFNDIKLQPQESYKDIINEYIIEIKIPKAEYDSMTSFCYRIMGKQSGYFLRLIWVAIALFFRIFRINIGNPFSGSFNTWTCSHLIAHGLKYHTSLSYIFDSYKYSLLNITEKDIVDILVENVGSYSVTNRNGSYSEFEINVIKKP